MADEKLPKQAIPGLAILILATDGILVSSSSGLLDGGLVGLGAIAITQIAVATATFIALVQLN
jgi:hypothetical protein